MIVGELYSMVSGTGGEILGGAETATGVGAPVGAATIACRRRWWWGAQRMCWWACSR
ncbi:MAG: hypothetical protein R3B70_28235 [Polyangiaceae bacterium]